MSDARYFVKCKASDIKNELQLHDPNSKSYPKLRKECMKRVIANLTVGNHEMAILLPFILKFYDTDNDLELLRMCCHFFTHFYYYHPEKYYENKQLFIKKLNDSSSLIRSLTIKTIVCFPFEKFQKDIAIPFLNKLLRDPDSYVRKTCCYSVGKLFEQNPNLVESSGLIDKLNDMLNDSSPIVVSATLSILDYIVSKSKVLALSIDEENVFHLLKILPNLNEFYQTYVIRSLLNYLPQDSTDAIYLIEKLIPFLQHDNTSVALNTLKVIVYLSNYIKSLQDAIPTIPKKIGNCLISLLSKPFEVQFLVLRNVILILLACPQLVQLDVSMFFIQYSDPIYIKDTKLEIIYLLANENNLKIVLRELEEYCTNEDITMARKSLRALGNLAIKLSISTKACVHMISNLCSSGISSIIQESIVIMKNIFRKYPDLFRFESLEIFLQYSDLIQEDDSKCSFLWLINNFNDSIPNYLSILKDFSYDFKNESLDVQLILLTCIVKFYLTNNEKGEKLLLNTLNLIQKEIIQPDLRIRANFYYNLLSLQNQLKNNCAKDIIITELPIIDTDQDKLDDIILEELELNIGSLSSIYLKPVKQIFRLSKTLLLPKSPALQRDRSIQFNQSSAEIIVPKVLKINIKSNSAMIKSPKANIGTGTFRENFKDDDPNEIDYNQKAVFNTQNFLRSPKNKRTSVYNSNRNSMLVSRNRNSIVLNQDITGSSYNSDDSVVMGSPKTSSSFGDKLKSRVKKTVLVSPRVTDRSFTS